MSSFNLLTDCKCPGHHSISNELQFVLTNIDRKCDPLSFLLEEAYLRSIVPEITFAKARVQNNFHNANKLESVNKIHFITCMSHDLKPYVGNFRPNSS